MQSQIKSEGGVLKGLYKGVSVNVTRGFLGPGTQLPAYNYLKSHTAQSHEMMHPVLQHALCAFGSSIVSIACVNPVDVIRTRMYNQPFDIKTGRGILYQNGIDAAIKILSKEGPGAFYKGGLTHLARLGPHMVLVFVFLEQLKSI